MRHRNWRKRLGRPRRSLRGVAKFEIIGMYALTHFPDAMGPPYEYNSRSPPEIRASHIIARLFSFDLPSGQQGPVRLIRAGDLRKNYCRALIQAENSERRWLDYCGELFALWFFLAREKPDDPEIVTISERLAREGWGQILVRVQERMRRDSFLRSAKHPHNHPDPFHRWPTSPDWAAGKTSSIRTRTSKRN